MRNSKVNFKMIFISIFFIAILYTCINYYYEHTFTPERWSESTPSKRGKMVDNLLKRYDLVGKTREEIISLLGEDKEIDMFKEHNNLVYFLGNEKAFIFIDMKCLVITFENNKSINIEFKYN